MSRDRERFGDDHGVVKKIKREIRDVYSNSNHTQYNNQMGISRRQTMSSNPSSLTGSLNTITPCAACKLLRRRCAEECPFSPYFSPHEPQKFAAVHKVFGASNVSKLLLEVPESQRADAANSLVFEANLRLRDPVYGCMGVISALQQQIQSLQAELHAVRSEIIKFRYREATSATSIVIDPSNNNNISADLMISAGMVSVAAPTPSLSPSAPPPPPPPPTPPPPRSIVISSSPSSSMSSLHNTPPPTSSTTGYSPISSDNNNNNINNVPYFD